MNKKIWISAIFILVSTSIAAGDDVDQALSGVAPEAVVQSAQQLIQSGANRASIIDATRAMLQYGFTARQTLAAHTVLMNALQQGLSPDPIINKAFEGISKHVAADGIVNAMQKIETRHAFAHQQAQKFAIRKAQADRIGQIIAAGLAAGIEPTGVAAIATEFQARSQHMRSDQRDALALETFKTARDMARLGVSSSQTVSLVGKALQHEFTAEQMQAMRTSFIKDCRATAPQSTAASYAKAIEQGKGFGGQGNGHGGATGGSGGSGGAGSGPGGGNGSGGSGNGGTGGPGGPGGPGGNG
jgi:hypothetical protein